MRNFTLTNYLSGECRSYGRLTKALLLFTAMVLFHFTSLQAQEAVDAEQTTQIGQTTTEFYGDGVPGDASNIDAKGPRKLSDAWFAKNNIDPENCVDPAD
ncbi:MAG TPA: hypothetical protein VJ911_10615, partial [Cryomorphaceae bacterium]|nr:hypothetical protein [Cryomorphaceae bacterium]